MFFPSTIQKILYQPRIFITELGHDNAFVSQPLLSGFSDIQYTLFTLSTVEHQWLEHLWDHGNLFETWVVHVTSSGSK